LGEGQAMMSLIGLSSSDDCDTDHGRYCARNHTRRQDGSVV
jgi:hypothetical protein